MLNYTSRVKFWQEHSAKADIFKMYDAVFGQHNFTEEGFYRDYLDDVRLLPFYVPKALSRSFNYTYLLRLMAAFPDMRPIPVFKSSKQIYPTLVVDYYDGNDVNTFNLEDLSLSAIESFFELLVSWFMELSLGKLNNTEGPIEKGVHKSIERWNNFCRLAMARTARNLALAGPVAPLARRKAAVYFPY